MTEEEVKKEIEEKGEEEFFRSQAFKLIRVIDAAEKEMIKSGEPIYHPGIVLPAYAALLGDWLMRMAQPEKWEDLMTAFAADVILQAGEYREEAIKEKEAQEKVLKFPAPPIEEVNDAS